MDMSELRNAGIDAIGGSLHKWLCNPIGAGFLFVKQRNIREIWPLMGDISADRTDIRKFEHQGTRPIQSLQTIAKAIEFHRLLGSASKYNRLTYLKLLWIGNKQALENFGKGLGILNDPIYQANMNAVTDLMNMDSFKLQSPLLPFNRGRNCHGIGERIHTYRTRQHIDEQIWDIHCGHRPPSDSGRTGNTTPEQQCV